ncbi:MAG: P-loop NTPase [Oscillospiraceae bacterium]|nr:P-loop NTPase [Oscillospiraceae bacterium]
MKIAVTGKGGAGKSTAAAALALMLARRGERVLCLDADPDPNFAAALGLGRQEREALVPISERLALIEERTGSGGAYGGVFKLNPEVSDVAETFAARVCGVELLVLGAVRGGGSGCACAASTFLRALVTDLVLFKRETLILDMEAGVEHLGRATAGGVDEMLIVAEPGQRAVDCARLIMRMAGEIGVRRTRIIANKVSSPEDEAFLRAALGELAAVLPYDENLRRADRDGVSALDALGPEARAALEGLLKALEVRP